MASPVTHESTAIARVKRVREYIDANKSDPNGKKGKNRIVHRRHDEDQIISEIYGRHSEDDKQRTAGFFSMETEVSTLALATTCVSVPG